MKHYLYTEEEKLIITDKEFSQIEILEDYHNGIIEVVYNSKNYLFIHNKNFKGNNILKYEDDIQILFFFSNRYGISIPKIFIMAKIFQKNKLKVYFKLMFLFWENSNSVVTTIKMIYSYLPILKNFFNKMSKLNKFLES